jgi:aryl-alcohol dehydrogenase-like predicted oxidoreductase
MRYHFLGNTDLNVSRIGLGLAALGRPGYINVGHAKDLRSIDKHMMEQQTHEVLSTAYQQGLRYIDVARSYGDAEAFLASWLNTVKPRDTIIGSKWGYTYTANWQVQADKHEIKEHSIDILEKQFAESITIFGRHLNLYQIHSATLESGAHETLWHQSAGYQYWFIA